MQHLYKYINEPSAAKFIASGQIKFTTIAKLNDPSEITVNVINEKVVESLQRLRKDGYAEDDLLHLRRQEAVFKRLAPHYQVIPAPTRVEDANMLIKSPIYNQINILEQRLAETVKEIAEKVGVFCLSKGYDSLPMWAHYAKKAEGFVVEYEHLNEVFAGDETGVLWSPTEVRYERGETGGVTFEPKSHDAIFFEKFKDWGYEREVRVVAPLDMCTPVTTK